MSGKQPVDMTRCKDELWLVKIPRNVMEYWKQECTGGMPLGEIRAGAPSTAGSSSSSYTMTLEDGPAKAYEAALFAKQTALKAAEDAHARALATLAPDKDELAEALKRAEHECEVAARNASRIHDLVGIEWNVRMGEPSHPMYAFSQRQSAKEIADGAPPRMFHEGKICGKGTLELSGLSGGSSYRRLVKQRTQIAADEQFKPPQEAHTEEEKKLERMLVAGRIDGDVDRGAKRKYTQSVREKKANAVEKPELTNEQIHHLVFSQFKLQAFWSKRELARAVGATKKNEMDRVAKFLDEIGERQRVGPHKNEYALKPVYRD